MKGESGVERYGRAYISPDYLREDFLALHLDLDSPEGDWRKAILIFEDRFQGRYFNPVFSLLQNENQNGFAAMALVCLLIETLFQFEEGLPVTQPGRNRESYVNFLRRELPDVFDREEKAEAFYKDIRCGILHSAQTKNGSQLTFGKDYVAELLDKGGIRVDVRNLAERIFEYYKNYTRCLHDSCNRYLRENFLKKMRHICRYEEKCNH